MKFKLIAIFTGILLIAATFTAIGAIISVKNTPIPIFPGAEGFGTNTRGAYGGSTNPVIYKVTNLNSGGSGSLKAGLEMAGPRIIVFEVSGVIWANDYIYIKDPYIQIAGQTAPSPGITLQGGIWIETHDVILQHMRVRWGTEDGRGYRQCDLEDCIQIGETGKNTYNVVIDHCSVSWSCDENMGTWWPAHDITWQWNIISEGFVSHSMGLISGPEFDSVSVHHNLFAHNGDRNPLIGGDGNSEVINNVVYNYEWDGSKFIDYEAYGNGPQYGNIVGNYYKQGLDTSSGNSPINLDDVLSTSRFYVHNNIDNKYKTSNSQDDWDCVEGRETTRSNVPVFTQTTNPITIYNVIDNYNIVLNNAGARPLDRDSVDNRIVNSVIAGTGHRIDSENDVGGFPSLANNYRALTIPSDPHNDNDGDGYTNLEEWLQNYADLIENLSSDETSIRIETLPSSDSSAGTETSSSDDTSTSTETPSSDDSSTSTETSSSDDTSDINLEHNHIWWYRKYRRNHNTLTGTETSSSSDTPTDTETSSSDDSSAGTEELPSDDTSTGTNTLSSGDTPTSIETLSSDDSSTGTETQSSDNQRTEIKKRLYNDISDNKPQTCSSSKKINVVYLDFIEKSSENFWVFVALLKFSITKP